MLDNLYATPNHKSLLLKRSKEHVPQTFLENLRITVSPHRRITYQEICITQALSPYHRHTDSHVR
jgi:hypothetical protein